MGDNLIFHYLKSLNPYYTGSYSISFSCYKLSTTCLSLNPYYTGSYSISSNELSFKFNKKMVLILIILEVTL